MNHHSSSNFIVHLNKLLLVFGVMFVSVNCGGVGSSSRNIPSNKYYEGLMIQTPAPKKGEQAGLISTLPSKLSGRTVFRIKGSKEKVFGGGVNQLKKLSHAELRAIFIVITQSSRGAELDLKVRLYGQQTVPVTALVELNGDITIEEGKWQRSEVPKNAQEIETRWGVGPLKTKKGAQWSNRALRSINIALSKLSADELKLLKGIPFVRKSKGKGDQAALYIQESDCDALIQVFNRAIISERYTFSGEAQTALPATVHPILHEIGHAVHSLPGRRIQCEYVQLIAQYNKLVKTTNKASGKKRAELKQQLDSKKQRIDKLLPLVESWRDRGPVINAYLKVKGTIEGPTPYGMSSAKESFAESFALYRVDPRALNRVMPKVYEWFKQNGHLQEAQKHP